MKNRKESPDKDGEGKTSLRVAQLKFHAQAIPSEVSCTDEEYEELESWMKTHRYARWIAKVERAQYGNLIPFEQWKAKMMNKRED
jgi:hypothetical protein